jgi:hypothetical protein
MGARPAEAVVEPEQHKGRKEDQAAEFLHELLFADFFFSQEPALNQLRVAFIEIKHQKNRENEVDGQENPALPEVERAGGNKQHCRRQQHAKESTANQS